MISSLLCCCSVWLWQGVGVEGFLLLLLEIQELLGLPSHCAVLSPTLKAGLSLSSSAGITPILRWCWDCPSCWRTPLATYPAPLTLAVSFSSNGQ